MKSRKPQATSHKPQAASRKARKSPFIPLFQRGKEGDLNIGTRGRTLRGSGKRGIQDSGFGLQVSGGKKPQATRQDAARQGQKRDSGFRLRASGKKSHKL